MGILSKLRKKKVATRPEVPKEEKQETPPQLPETSQNLGVATDEGGRVIDTEERRPRVERDAVGRQRFPGEIGQGWYIRSPDYLSKGGTDTPLVAFRTREFLASNPELVALAEKWLKEHPNKE